MILPHRFRIVLLTRSCGSFLPCVRSRFSRFSRTNADEKRIHAPRRTRTAAAVSEQLNKRDTKQPPLLQMQRDYVLLSRGIGEGGSSAHYSSSAFESGKF